MKKKFSRILGVGLTIALLTSLMVVAVPVSADVTQPSVTVSPATISAPANYSIRFTVNKQLTGNTTCTTSDGAFAFAKDTDVITVTATGATDTATFDTAGTGNVTGVMSGTGTWVGALNGGTANFATIGEVCTVTVTAVSTTADCAGTWSSPVGAPTAAVTVGGSGDTITITLPADTTVATGTTATIVAAPGWINSVWKDATITPASVVGSATARTVTITLAVNDDIGEGAQIRINLTTGITNPSAIATYTLTAATSEEIVAVASTAYSISEPVVGALEGIVQVRNPADVLIYQDTGGNAISDALATVTADGYYVVIGPGTYDEEIGLDCPAFKNVTIKASGTAAETIVYGNWTIDEAGATLEGLNIRGQVTTSDGGTNPTTVLTPIVVQNCLFSHGIVPAARNYVTNSAGYVTIQGNTFECDAGAVQDTAITVGGGVVVTISGNSFSLDETIIGSDDTGVLVNGGTPAVTVTGCDFTGASGIGYNSSANCTDTITENTFDGLQTAILASNALTKMTVRGNAIQNGTVPYMSTSVTATAQIDINAATSVLIDGNDIANNAGYTVDVADGVASAVTVAGNFFSGNTYGLILRETGALQLNAQLNNWGASSGPAIASNLAGTGDAIVETIPGSVLYRPWATVGTSDIATASLAAAGTIDRSTTVGISFTSNVGVGSVTLARYISNPAISNPRYAALANAYYDVFVPGAPVGATDVYTILFYATGIDANTSVYYYSTLQQSWWPCSTVAVAGNNAYVIVTVSAATSPTTAELSGTPFVLVNIPPAPTVTITSPDIGAYDIPIDPMFTWNAVPGALRYELTLSEDPTFAIIEWSYNVDDNFYKATDSLRYSTTYYWRVRALTGEPYQVGPSWVTPSGPWSTGIFTTEAEPVEVVEEPPVTEITVESPDVTVTPGEVTVDVAPVVPDYLLWTIVAIGAVLIIALIVLIVRTRRVA